MRIQVILLTKYMRLALLRLMHPIMKLYVLSS